VRKKSKYRPKGVFPDPLAWVLSGMKTVATVPEAGVNLQLKNHSALESALRGQATRNDIDILIGAYNVAEAFARMGIGQDWAVEIKAAQDAIFHMGRKCADTNNFIFTGPEMNAVKMGMEIHDRQLEAATVRQLEQALSIVGKEIKSGKARPIKEKA
jgi:hypothetical protein